jgi:hypothetical protein
LADYLAGCKRAAIQPQGVKDFKVGEQLWVDVPLLEILTKRAVLPFAAEPEAPPADRKTGGPRPDAVRGADPDR